jgi:hypothetical protein
MSDVCIGKYGNPDSIRRPFVECYFFERLFCSADLTVKSGSDREKSMKHFNEKEEEEEEEGGAAI